MTQRADGSGSITFGDEFPYMALFGGIAVPTMGLYVATQFFRIPDVARVYPLIHDAQRLAWKEPSAATSWPPQMSAPLFGQAWEGFTLGVAFVAICDRLNRIRDSS